LQPPHPHPTPTCGTPISYPKRAQLVRKKDFNGNTILNSIEKIAVIAENESTTKL
jgi:hypothetical protein